MEGEQGSTSRWPNGIEDGWGQNLLFIFLSEWYNSDSVT